MCKWDSAFQLVNWVTIWQFQQWEYIHKYDTPCYIVITYVHMVSKVLPAATVQMLWLFMTTCTNLAACNIFVALFVITGYSFVTLDVKSCAMRFTVHSSINNYI